jgi:hypothetical protein
MAAAVGMPQQLIYLIPFEFQRLRLRLNLETDQQPEEVIAKPEIVQ